MTIAAGFLCRDGVVLCADTHHTGAVAAKTHHAKLGNFDCPGGKLAFAVAGHRDFAWSAIERLRSKLEAAPPEETISVMERVLDREYRKQVFAHPDRSGGAFDYWLLIALWKSPQSVQLFSTSQTSLLPVDEFACLGIGAELATYLIAPCFRANMADRRVMHLATYALAGTKEGIEGCSGSTLFLILRKDGSLGFTSTYSNPWKQIEENSLVYDLLTRELFLGLANFEIQDSDFQKDLTENFVAKILKVREEWSALRRQRMDVFATLNPHLTPIQVEQAYLLWTMGLPPIPPPSPESPGGSGES